MHQASFCNTVAYDDAATDFKLWIHVVQKHCNNNIAEDPLKMAILATKLIPGICPMHESNSKRQSSNFGAFPSIIRATNRALLT